jgi:serine protease Do
VAQIWRKGASKDINVVVEEMKDDDQPKAAGRGKSGKDKEPADKANRLGLIVSPVSEEDKKELKIKGGLKIDQNVGSARNLQEGDVILALVNKGTVTELKSVDQFNQLLAKIETGSNVTLQIRRGESTAFLSMRVNE